MGLASSRRKNSTVSKPGIGQTMAQKWAEAPLNIIMFLTQNAQNERGLLHFFFAEVMERLFIEATTSHMSGRVRVERGAKHVHQLFAFTLLHR